MKDVEAVAAKYRYSEIIPAIPAEYRYSKIIPAVESTSHTEYGIQERTRDYKPGVPEIPAKTHVSYQYKMTEKIPLSHQEAEYTRRVIDKEAAPAVAEVSHMEYGQQERTRTYTPAVPAEDAVTRVVHHDAVTKHHDAILAVAGIWQNFSPNKGNGPFDGPPTWPSDSRGTWQHSDREIPPGQEGPNGVYQNGGGNGSWFYRHAGTKGVAAYDEVVKAAWDEMVVVTAAVPAVPAHFGDWTG